MNRVHASTLTLTRTLENSQLGSSSSLPWKVAMKMDPLTRFAFVNAPVNLSTWKRETGACLCPIHYPYRDRGAGQGPSAVAKVILGKTNFHFYFFTRFQREGMGRREEGRSRLLPTPDTASRTYSNRWWEARGQGFNPSLRTPSQRASATPSSPFFSALEPPRSAGHVAT